MEKITFNPILVTKKLLSSLDERPKSVLKERFGLASNKFRTLDSIGRDYGITRERVRQIESFALDKIRKSKEFFELQNIFDEIKANIEGYGGLVQEEDFSLVFSKRKDHGPYIFFLMTVNPGLFRIKEDKDFYCSWTTDLERANDIRNIFKKLHNEMDDETLYSEKEILSLLDKYLKTVLQDSLGEKVLSFLIKVSRVLSPNDLGEWGLVSSPYIKPKGMRDYAFLVIRRHGSPMHFSEIASAITELFNRPAHVQTVHNEAIKDDRFVLVGRGLYALKEWGYEGGIVRNVIEKILNGKDALSKEDIVKKVLKERYVKENTILVNLQNRKFFKKDTQGRYTLV